MEGIKLDFNYYHALVNDLPKDLNICPFNEWVDSSWLSEDQKIQFKKNYSLNRSMIQPHTRSQDGKGKVGILIGASPAVKKNIEVLKGLDENFILVACPTILKYLREEGITPNYVFALEGRDHWVGDFDCKTDDLTLVATPFVSHEALKRWQGKVLWYMLPGSPDYNEGFRKDWEDKVDYEISGGNVISTALCWMLKYLGVRDIAFVGMSLCFYEDYYFDGRNKTDERPEVYNDRFMAMDIYGKLCATTPALAMYKVWLEAFTQVQSQYNTKFYNCTEDGILGVMPKPIVNNGKVERLEPLYIPWMSIIPLNMLVKTCKEVFQRRKVA